jgi:SAM-dependent methyltransferase
VVSLFDALAKNDSNKLMREDHAAHDWYRFVLSFPAHIVRDYLGSWNLPLDRTVLDPFCGTGTTIVEAQKHGWQGIGVDGNPVAHFATSTKLDWSPHPETLIKHAEMVARVAQERLSNAPRMLKAEAHELLLTDSISPLPLHKLLTLKEVLDEFHVPTLAAHELLSLAKIAVMSASNLRFGPEVGVSSKKKLDADVIEDWLIAVRTMGSDLHALRNLNIKQGRAMLGDSRTVSSFLEPASIDAVFSSPPYPNEKDYTRTTRLEAVLLNFLESKSDLRALKKGLLRSNTRNVYKDDTDDEFVASFDSIQSIASAIESRRLELEKTSGFEKLYARVTKLYFGGLARHLTDLKSVLRPGAKLAFVVGDQASYLRILIPTGQLLAEIAVSLGYELIHIDLFRTRFSTATRSYLREEVVVLRWRG